MKEIRYFRLPVPLLNAQKSNPVTKDLFLTETGEIEAKAGSIWEYAEGTDMFTLIFCSRGEGILQILQEQLPVKSEQFFMIPPKAKFKFYSSQNTNTRFLVAGFNGKNARQLCREYFIVRSLVPSVNNMVANREMLFEEMFNNLNKGFHDQNLVYVNFCFGHLLATFIYANKTSEDIAEESNPLVRQALNFLNRNLGKKLTLREIAYEVGYSPTYFTTLFRKETNYSPLSYFSHLKILKACEYLDYTKIKIKEISFNLGYSDPYYFAKDFKKKMGLSPRQYRNRLKN